MGDIKNFIKQYRGAIIGIIIAILILITNLQKLIIGIILIAIGAIIGNYVQQNKKEKESLQKINRLGQMPYGVQTLVANSLQEANEVTDEISKRK